MVVASLVLLASCIEVETGPSRPASGDEPRPVVAAAGDTSSAAEGTFRIDIDPRAGTATVVIDTQPTGAGLHTVRQAAWCDAPVLFDGVEGGGPAGSIELSTRPGSVHASRPGDAPPDGCRVPALERDRPEHDDLYEVDGVLCFDVVARSFAESEFTAVYATVTSVDGDGHSPWTYPYGTGADPADVAAIGALDGADVGLFAFGDLRAGAEVVSRWTVRNGSDAPFSIRGRVVHHVVETCGNGVDDDCDGRVDEGCGAVREGDACVDDADCATMRCDDGRCQPPHRCGDGIVGPDEVCDDGDADEDMCTSDCRLGDCALEPSGPMCGYANDDPRASASDFVHLFRPTNHRPVETWPTPSRTWRLRAGTWAADWDESRAVFTGFGVTDVVASWGEVERDLDARVDALPPLEPHFVVRTDGVGHAATRFMGTSGDGLHRSRLVEGGRFLNRLWTPTVSYASAPDLAGEIELVAMPRHIVLTHLVDPTTISPEPFSVEVRLGGRALPTAALDSAVWDPRGRAVRLEEAGLLVAVYDVEDASTQLVREGDELVARRSWAGTADTDLVSLSVVVVPVSGAETAFEAVYVDPDALAVDYTLLTRAGEPAADTVPATWDERFAAVRVPMGTLQDAGGPRRADWTNDDMHVWYGRHRLAIDSALPAPVHMPLVLSASDRIGWYITGGVPIVRDPGGGPLGWAMQVSKNWHEPGAAWYRLVAHPTLVGDDPHVVELTFASARWGRPWAASHAQLSLVGWGTAGGRWDESAIGCFGESVTYDPDLTLGRAMMDDVRPVFVRSDAMWNWTGNVGGADFLQYRDAVSPGTARRLQGVRTSVISPGPLLTDVAWDGVSSDGRIEARVHVQLAASDDLVRQWMHFTYTFVDDVEYSRLAFAQVAADRYADNGFARVAFGDAEGVRTVREVLDHRATGYASADDRGIALTGEAPWVMLFDNQLTGEALPEHFADVGFVIRDYEARVGDAVLTTPHVNLHRTFNRVSQLGVEVGLPDDPGSSWCGAPCEARDRFVPAGSTVSFTLEYVVLPADPSRYYGVSDWITALDAGVMGTPALMQRIARDGAVSVIADVGEVVSVTPPLLRAARGPVAASFTMTGGLGYVPVTVTGLPRPDGWIVERRDSEAWILEPVEVMGGDGHQARWDEADDAWALTWSLPNRGSTDWRIRWVAPTTD